MVAFAKENTLNYSTLRNWISQSSKSKQKSFLPINILPSQEQKLSNLSPEKEKMILKCSSGIQISFPHHLKLIDLDNLLKRLT
jgi:transposase-like protein